LGGFFGLKTPAPPPTAAFAGVDTTPLTQATVQINAYNVINSLQTRAAIIGCV
jgi:hypothetical protein